MAGMYWDEQVGRRLARRRCVQLLGGATLGLGGVRQRGKRIGQPPAELGAEADIGLAVPEVHGRGVWHRS